jgi:hypothetical protein
MQCLGAVLGGNHSGALYASDRKLGLLKVAPMQLPLKMKAWPRFLPAFLKHVASALVLVGAVLSFLRSFKPPPRLFITHTGTKMSESQPGRPSMTSFSIMMSCVSQHEECVSNLQRVMLRVNTSGGKLTAIRYPKSDGERELAEDKKADEWGRTKFYYEVEDSLKGRTGILISGAYLGDFDIQRDIVLEDPEHNNLLSSDAFDCNVPQEKCSVRGPSGVTSTPTAPRPSGDAMAPRAPDAPNGQLIPVRPAALTQGASTSSESRKCCYERITWRKKVKMFAPGIEELGKAAEDVAD